MEVNGSEGVDEGRYTRAAEVETVDLVRKNKDRSSPRKRGNGKSSEEEEGQKTLRRRVEEVMFADTVTPLRCSIIKQLSGLLRSNCDVNQGNHPSFIALGIGRGDGI